MAGETSQDHRVTEGMAYCGFDVVLEVHVLDGRRAFSCEQLHSDLRAIPGRNRWPAWALPSPDEAFGGLG